MSYRFILKAIGAVLLLGILGSFLFGSALWSMLGLTDDLTIDGRADIVRQIDKTDFNDWQVWGGDPNGTRFSSLEDISADNLDRLELSWMFKTNTFDGREGLRDRASFQATPILVEDSLVFCTPFNEVIALEPDTGKQKWKYDAEISLDIQPANRFNCRGVSFWQDSQEDRGEACHSRLLMGTVDARLIALDAKTGELCTDFANNGQISLRPSLPLRWPGEMQISSAPAIAGDVLISGMAISDNLRTTAPLGTVHAFDVRTGAQLWSFNPIPQTSDDPAAATWAGDSARTTGHANVWSSISVDPDRSLAFLPTSSPSPDYYGGNRIGDNRYANSVVALDTRTGEVRWHFQTVHHDLWDYDVPSQPGLYSVWRDGKAHDVVAVATKTGFVFVLDRDTGEPFLPIEERSVPQDPVAGEVLSATQPFPVRTPAVVPSRLAPEDAFGVTWWDKRACRKLISGLRTEGIYTPPSERGTLAYPFIGGGANWGSTAYDPQRNLLVINMSNVAAFVRVTQKQDDDGGTYGMEDGAEFAPMEGAPYSMTRGALLSPLGLPCSPPPWGVIAGIDLDSGGIVWRKTLGTTEDLAPGGLALKLGTPNFGGPIVTASGLIFIGAAMDHYLRAFSVTDGSELWKARLPAGGQATPMTYRYNGKQYVVIAAGGHSMSGTKPGDNVMAYALSDAPD